MRIYCAYIVGFTVGLEFIFEDNVAMLHLGVVSFAFCWGPRGTLEP